MVNAVWLSPEWFQRILLPKPPPSAMLTSKQLKAFRTKLEEMHRGEGYKSRGQQARPPRTPEDQLALEFTKIVNEYVLRVVQGRSTNPNARARKSSQISRIVLNAIGTGLNGKTSGSTDGPLTASTPVTKTDAPTANPVPPFPVTLVDVVPSYSMRLSPYKDEEKNKTHAAIFKTDVVAQLQDERPNWAYQRLFCEFRLPGTENDPFEDGEQSSDMQLSALGRQKVRDQLIGYADRVFAYQHRTTVYSFIVFGREFRFLRWDRAGVFVTQKIDYVKDTRTFVELLLSFLALDDASQGIDTTVTLLEEGSELYKLMDSLAAADPAVLKMRVLPYDEGYVLPPGVPIETIETPSTTSAAQDHEAEPVASMDHAFEPVQPAASSSSIPFPPAPGKIIRRPKEGTFVFQYVLNYFARSLQEGWPRYRVPIGNDTFLVARPIFDTAGLTGRGTRAYVAWHEQSHSFVFLKDVWRPFYKGLETDSEGDILKRLNDAGVEHIPTLLCHGQVAFQETLVSHYAQYVDHKTNDERKTSVTPRGKKRARDGEYSLRICHYAHHRLSTDEVCLPLVAFTSSKQLVSLVADCVDGHADAVDKCSLLHRDISCGNILILPTFEERQGETGLRVKWRGVLCDWELSKPVAPSKDEKGRRPARTGTWKYMSVASLRNVLHVSIIADEIESFFNVIIYNAVRYLPHTAESYVPTFIRNYFVRAEIGDNGELTVGNRKAAAIAVDGYLPVEDARGRRRLYFGSRADQNQGLNSIVVNLMRWFKARYEVLSYEAWSADTPEDAPDPELSPPSAQRPRLESDAPAQTPQDAMFDTAVIPDGPSRPSQATYDEAAHLKTHHDVKKLLRHALSNWKWPESEVKSDHLKRAQSGAGATGSPLDGVLLAITLPSPAISFNSNAAPRAPKAQSP